MDKNNILYMLLAIFSIIIFFHPKGVISLMNNQNELLKQEKEIKGLKEEIKSLEKKINLLKYENYEPNNFKKLEPYFRKKGIVEKNEEYYNLQENNN
ncbi:MAG: hypothetical protein CMG00_09325 [Candidatus Marinimicrobia bacterium]|nr:hypothetical protein [Candidatus Neomarinimicrobiota bacterium]|tara:strand:+ start:10212 stop:10502 length:291 start_codon:yes stop_codon:yes gene_type:complete